MVFFIHGCDDGFGNVMISKMQITDVSHLLKIKICTRNNSKFKNAVCK